MGYTLIWAPVLQAAPRLLAGLLVTLELTAIGAVSATLLGLLGGVLMGARRRTLRLLAIGYVELMRNSPSMVKMYFIYFGLPTLGFYPTAFWSGATALGLHNAAYLMDVFRAAFNSIPEAQREAAASLGLGRWLVFRKIVLPQALPRALPGLGNYWVEIVKDTSITSALSVQEFYYVTVSVIALNMRTYEFFLVVAAVYLTLTAGVAGATRLAELHMSRQTR